MNLIKLKKLANAQKFDEVEDLWPDALSDPENELDDLLPVVAQVARLGNQKSADALLGLLLAAVQEQAGAPARLDAARAAAAALPRSSMLAKELARLYRARYPDFAELPDLTKVLLADDSRLGEAVELIDRFLRLRPGAFLSHPDHIDPGRVESLDAEAPSMVVSFRGRTHTLDAEAVSRVIILPPDHFPSLLIYGAEELKRTAVDDPVALVALALKSCRGHACSYRDIKQQVTALLGEDAWTGWWKTARSLLKKAPRISMTGSAQPSFKLLREDLSYDKRLRDAFARLKTPRDKLAFVLDHLDESRREKTSDPELLRDLGNAVAQMAGPLLKNDPALTLGCLAVHAEVAARGASVAQMNTSAALQVLARIEDRTQLPRLYDDRLLKAVLIFVRKVAPQEWTALWTDVLPRSGRQLCEWMARELVAAGHAEALEAALARVIERPTASPDVLAWTWRARLNPTPVGEALAGFGQVTALHIFTALIAMIDAIGRMSAVSDDKRLRRVQEMAQEALGIQDGQPVNSLLAATTSDEAKELKSRIEGNGGLRPSLRNALLSRLRLAHPDLFREVVRAWEEDVFYTTQRGLQERRAELEVIVSEEIPAVAKQIGEAASHGDLSENAEYTAALEKRDQLTSRATRIEAELSRAKIIDPALADVGFVNVGTRVTALDLDADAEEVYAFMGVWDSDPENNVLSYNAPLALAFMGSRAGDEVVYGEGEDRRRWRVLKVEPGV